MSTRTITAVLLGLPMLAGCSPPSMPRSEDPTENVFMVTNEIKNVPAVNRGTFPDSIGYLYQGSLATILWLENQPKVLRLEDLEQRMGRTVERGMAGEILSNTMQHIDQLPDTQPTLPEMSKSTVQSLRFMAQYAFVTGDYAASLGNALNTYNADPVRLRTIAETVTQVDAELGALTASNPAGSLPAPPPAADRRMLRPGRYFSDFVKDRERAYLVKSTHDLQHAINSRNPTAYAISFADVFLMQNDINLTKDAHEALAQHHVNSILVGQPLDAVVSRHVTSLDPDRPYSLDQLCLINQISLISNDLSVSKSALVAALLLIDEDHKQAESDPTLTPLVIWGHVGDVAWLVSQYARIRADGTTEDQARAQVDSILTSL